MVSLHIAPATAGALCSCLGVFAPPTFGITYLRCRIASNAGEVDLPTGAASSGEVEDRWIEIAERPPSTVTLSSFSAVAPTVHPEINEVQGSGDGTGRQYSALLAGVLVLWVGMVSLHKRVRGYRRPT